MADEKTQPENPVTIGLRDNALEAIAALTVIYMNTSNVALARQCRLTVKALMAEYGPEKQ